MVFRLSWKEALCSVSKELGLR